jgi:hypothetical protein
MKITFGKLLLALASAALISGCGGGDIASAPLDQSPVVVPDSPVVVPESPAPVTSITVSGVAATGAAFVDAVIRVIDSTGAVVGTSAPVGENGTYTVTLTDGAKAPFVLVASRTTADGQVQSLVSVLESSTATTANITPVTNLIAALLSPSGDPTKLAAELAAGTVQVTPESVAASVTEVKTILATLLDATGTTGADPLKDSFTVDGTGYDRLLDSISISIVPAGTTSTNIEVAVKQSLADGQQPASISFSSDATTIDPLPVVDSSTLVASGTSVLIGDLLKQVTACYALPLADRISSGGTTAAHIVAAACKNAFFGNDPGTFLSNGNPVGKGKAFNGIFVAGGTGVVFSQGTYEFTRGNGDVVVGYKSRDAAGNETFDTFALRKDTDGKLKLIGNQYAYPGGVVPYQQLRQFITLGQSAYNYRSTGYVLNVDNRLDSLGNPLFNKVEVVTPKGQTLTLKVSPGSSYLPLVRNGSTLGTSFLRLRSEFDNSATQGDIRTIDPNQFYSATPYTDLDIAALPSQSAWTFRYFLAANATTTPDAIQTYKTRARALTIAELRLQGLSELGTSVIASLQSEANTTTGVVPLPTDGPADLGDPAAGEGWTVPAGALPATQAQIYGRYSGAGFNDSVKFGSTARTAVIGCTPATGSDPHCSPTVPGAFAAGAVTNGLHLWARDSSGREYANFYALYKLTLP